MLTAWPLDRGLLAPYGGPMSGRDGTARTAAAIDGATTVSWSALLEPRHALPAGAVVLCTLAPAFGFFVTATATVLPSVVREIGGLAFYAWASTAYAVASILGSAGSLVLVRGRDTRATLLVSAVILVAGTVGCAMAPTMTVLIAGRALQGLGSVGNIKAPSRTPGHRPLRTPLRGTAGRRRCHSVTSWGCVTATVAMAFIGCTDIGVRK